MISMSCEIGFADVKAILEQAIVDWEAEHGRAPSLSLHGPTFGWETKDQLLESSARGRQLINAGLIGSGDASDANLVKVLLDGLPPFIRRMPAEGPYIDAEDVEKIQAWIENGAPD